MTVSRRERDRGRQREGENRKTGKKFETNEEKD